MLDILKNRFFHKRLRRREAFALFKEVLEGHNRGLELIADMGEKIGGEFLFDINYLRPAYAELSAAARQSIEKFNLLTSNRYSNLLDVFERIDARARDAMDEVESASGRHLIFHEDISWDEAGEVGGKNANIAEAKNLLGIKTPAGFALTLRAYSDFIAFSGLEGLIQGLGDDPEPDKRHEIRTKIKDSELPPGLLSEIEHALSRMKMKSPAPFNLAVRSSASGEDGDYHSFAGIFESALNVPADGASVARAYREVVSSLFSEKAIAYRRERGIKDPPRMAVCCMAMVDAEAAGVAYSSDPSGKPEVLISSAWGLGVSVVDGSSPADHFTVGHDGNGLEIIKRVVENKRSSAVLAEGGGVKKAGIADARQSSPSITDDQALRIASLALKLEAHFKAPQDIEWAIDKDGNLMLLQARPLRVQKPDRANGLPETASAASTDVLFSGAGAVVQPGAGAGPVFMLLREADIIDIPKGAVVVSRTDSAKLASVLHKISAVITGSGSPTSHMSALCREFKVPAVVGCGDATKALQDGGVVTFYAGDGSFAVYKGVAREILQRKRAVPEEMESLHEYRKKRQMLRFISPLNLIDPLMDDFSPEKCRSIHDILRFVHEKSVAELMEIASARAGDKEKLSRLELSIPAGIIVMDIGGGLSTKGAKASMEDVASAPLKAVLAGMVSPGMWKLDAVPLKIGDLLSSMVRMPEVTEGGSHTDLNLAVASSEYVNLSMRFGYHFNMLDCYMGENPRDNHIHFRFSGGATEMSKRGRRIQLLSMVLDRYGLDTKTKGDLLIGRISGIPANEASRILEMLGALIAFARQLDAQLDSNSDVEEKFRDFTDNFHPA